MKRKTLKDIEKADHFHRNKFSVREGHTELISKRELRKEAVKWVKTDDDKHLKKITTLDWLNFFNLTEKHLK